MTQINTVLRNKQYFEIERMCVNVCIPTCVQMNGRFRLLHQENKNLTYRQNIHILLDQPTSVKCLKLATLETSYMESEVTICRCKLCKQTCS